VTIAITDRAMQQLVRLYRRPAGRFECSVRAAVLLALVGIREAWRFRRREHLIIVHQPGKVGSSAIVASLRASLGEDGYRTYHSHLLNRSSRAAVWAARGQRRWAPKRTWAESAILSRILPRYRGEATVVSVVREPGARLVSSVLETPEWYLDNAPTAADLENVPSDELRRAVEECGRRDGALGWYSNELQGYWGFSLDGAADALRRGETYCERRGNRRLVVLRFDDLADAYPAMTLDVFGRQLDLPVVNTTVQKRVHPEVLCRLQAFSSEFFVGAHANAASDLPFEVYRPARSSEPTVGGT
jgi:hypothetical protein